MLQQMFIFFVALLLCSSCGNDESNRIEDIANSDGQTSSDSVDAFCDPISRTGECRCNQEKYMYCCYNDRVFVCSNGVWGEEYDGNCRNEPYVSSAVRCQDAFGDQP